MKQFFLLCACLCILCSLFMSCSLFTDPVYEGRIKVISAAVQAEAIEITWNDSPDEQFDHIKVTWGREGASASSRKIPAGVESCLFSGLEEATRYEIRIRAVSEAGENSTAVSSFSLTTAIGTMSETYIFLYTASELNAIRRDTAGNYILMSDIDLGSVFFNSNEGWPPIGDRTEPFTGAFDGNGHSVYNLRIQRERLGVYSGFFGFVSGAHITSLQLSSAYIDAGQYTGMLAGYCEHTEIQDCHVSGIITARDYAVGGLVGGTASSSIQQSTSNVDMEAVAFYHHGGLVGWNISTPLTDCRVSGNINSHENNRVGGLVGFNSSSELRDCHAVVEVTGGKNVGGLVGENAYSPVSDCSAGGTVTSTAQPPSGECIGGLVGNNIDSEIVRSYAKVRVIASYNDCGGLIGRNTSNVSNCYATGAVKGGSGQIGGLIGNTMNSVITNSYAVGFVEGLSNVGGLIGYSFSSTVTSCFYNSETSGQSDSGKGQACTTDQMKKEITYTGWNFTAVWNIDGSGGVNSGYPFLRNN